MLSYISAARAGVVSFRPWCCHCWRPDKKKDIEARIAALEKGATFNATQAAIRKREEEFLTKLRYIKAHMDKEQEASKIRGSLSSDELSTLREENAKLKAQLTKHNYRIHHLVTGMEELRKVKNNNN